MGCYSIEATPLEFGVLAGKTGARRNLCRPAKSVVVVVFAAFDLVSNRRSV